MEALEKDEENISRKDLRYIVIERNSLHVCTSKKSKSDMDTSMMDPDLSIGIDNKNSADKVLDLSRNMKVETKFISKRHGHCVCVVDKKISKVVCTLLPVRLNPSFFRDKEYSQVIGSKKFKKIRDDLIGVGKRSGHSLRRNESLERKTKWPLYMPQIAPEAQNTSAICLHFALDAAIHLDQ